MIVKTEGSFATIKQSNTDSDLFGTMFAAFPAAVYIEMVNKYGAFDETRTLDPLCRYLECSSIQHSKTCLFEKCEFQAPTVKYHECG